MLSGLNKRYGNDDINYRDRHKSRCLVTSLITRHWHDDDHRHQHFYTLLCPSFSSLPKERRSTRMPRPLHHNVMRTAVGTLLMCSRVKDNECDIVDTFTRLYDLTFREIKCLPNLNSRHALRVWCAIVVGSRILNRWKSFYFISSFVLFVVAKIWESVLPNNNVIIYY